MKYLGYIAIVVVGVCIVAPFHIHRESYESHTEAATLSSLDHQVVSMELSKKEPDVLCATQCFQLASAFNQLAIHESPLCALEEFALPDGSAPCSYDALIHYLNDAMPDGFSAAYLETPDVHPCIAVFRGVMEKRAIPEDVVRALALEQFSWELDSCWYISYDSIAVFPPGISPRGILKDGSFAFGNTIFCKADASSSEEAMSIHFGKIALDNVRHQLTESFGYDVLDSIQVVFPVTDSYERHITFSYEDFRDIIGSIAQFHVGYTDIEKRAWLEECYKRTSPELSYPQWQFYSYCIVRTAAYAGRSVSDQFDAPDDAWCKETVMELYPESVEKTVDVLYREMMKEIPPLQ